MAPALWQAVAVWATAIALLGAILVGAVALGGPKELAYARHILARHEQAEARKTILTESIPIIDLTKYPHGSPTPSDSVFFFLWQHGAVAELVHPLRSLSFEFSAWKEDGFSFILSLEKLLPIFEDAFAHWIIVGSHQKPVAHFEGGGLAAVFEDHANVDTIRRKIGILVNCDRNVTPVRTASQEAWPEAEPLGWNNSLR